MSIQQIVITYPADKVKDQPAFIQGIILATDQHVTGDFAQVDIPPVTKEKIFLVCDACGEAFDNNVYALRHEVACETPSYNLAFESDAM